MITTREMGETMKSEVIFWGLSLSRSWKFATVRPSMRALVLWSVTVTGASTVFELILKVAGTPEVSPSSAGVAAGLGANCPGWPAGRSAGRGLFGSGSCCATNTEADIKSKPKPIGNPRFLLTTDPLVGQMPQARFELPEPTLSFALPPRRRHCQVADVGVQSLSAC